MLGRRVVATLSVVPICEPGGTTGRVIFWQRFLPRPPTRAWAIGLVPALVIVLAVFAASDNSGVRFAGGVVATTVMHLVAAAVWPRVSGGDR